MGKHSSSIPNEGRYFQVIFGYRSLIDWSKSSNWTRTPSAERLHGPVVFDTSGGRPYERQGNTTTKIPGYQGFYYDVAAPQRGMIRTSDGSLEENVSEIMDELGEHAQQWLYLAAEKMATRSQQLVSSNKIKQDEIDRIRKIINFYSFPPDYKRESDAWDDVREGGIHFTKAHGEKNINKKTRSNVDRFINQKTPGEVLMGVSLGIGIGLGGLGEGYAERTDKRYKDYGKQISGFRSGATKSIPGLLETEETTGDKQFRAMLVGIDKQWINAFAQNIFKKGLTKEISKLAKKVEEYAKLSYRRTGGAGGGSEKPINIQIEMNKKGVPTLPGQTVQEWALAGAGVLDPDYKKEKGMLSNLIDVKFKKAIQIEGIDKKRAFERADLTTSLFRTGGHHGVGYFNQAGEWENKGKLKDNIEIFYNKRIEKYNTLIKLIKKATGQETLYEARQSMGGATEWASTLSTVMGKERKIEGKWGKGQQRSFYGELVEHLEKLDKGIKYSSAVALEQDLIWIIHHMGNMLPGGDRSPYANIMPIKVDGATHTLVLGFVLESDGRYKPMSDNGSYVYISPELPMEYLYSLAITENKKLTFGEFVAMGNEQIVAAAIEGGVATTGVLAKIANKTSVAEQRVSMTKISTPAVSAVLEKVTNELFKNMTHNIGKKMGEEIHDNAVRFSVLARNPDELKNVHRWWSFARNFLLTREAIDERIEKYSRLKEISPSQAVQQIWNEERVHRYNRSDPFWYLWAAPYVTTRYAKRGGTATQGFVT